ncbi:MAG: hypothetical protein IJV72_08600 [Clostridia bacterium]|nr:hypothetical protein [Clostridia bacterium]
MKKVLAIALALLMSFLMLPVSALAADVGSVPSEYTPSTSATAVSTVAEFETMGEGREYYLTQDIDFGGKVYTKCIAEVANFKLDGCGHTIKNFSIRPTEVVSVGMYYDVETDASFKNLVIGTAAAPISVKGTTNSAVLFANVNRAVTVENVKIYANVETGGNAGMVASYVGTGTPYTFRNIETYGSVTGHDVGGLLGHIKRFHITSEINNCVNHASVTGTNAGGIVGYSRAILTIENCTNYGAVETNASYAGGIIASFGATSTVPMTITGCSNHGTVKGMKTESKDININAGIGGILGSTNTFVYLYESAINIDGCMNYGNISTNGVSAGAIMGKGIAFSETDSLKSSITIKNCGNVGTITYGDTNAAVGIFVSAVSTNKLVTLSITNSFNIGATNSTKAYAAVYNMNGDPASGDARVTDFYYLSGGSYSKVANTSDVAVINGSACTAEQFASGEIAFVLGASFGQTVGVDNYPIPGGPMITLVGDDYVNIGEIDVSDNGSAAPFIQTTEVDTEGKQSVRFIIAVSEDALDSAKNAEMTIKFSKTGSNDISYSLKTGEIKLFKSVLAGSSMYMAADGVVLIGVAIDGVVATDWESASIVLSVTDNGNSQISELSVSASYTK